jgi:carboxymethylenebutenolidase
MRRTTSGLVLSIAGLAVILAVSCGGGTSEGDDYAGRMAEEHAGDRPVASGAAAEEPALSIEERDVIYATVDGREVRGFFARPAGPWHGGPALIVIHEWWGLNDNVRSMARRLAGEGYAALAVDLYEGEVAEDPARARELMTASMGREGDLEENLRQAEAWLENEAGATSVGTIGWCFGGGWSLRAALLMPGKIDATVIYYGRLVTDPEQLAALETPILGIFGAEDEGIPLEGVREFERVLGELGKPVEIHVYEGAGHAFANPSGTRYVPEAAEDAWSQTLSFFSRHLE